MELAAGQRRANVEGAFRWRRGWRTGADIEGLTVVLIDDVSTTGATIESCARVLKQRGARKVFALTAARVVTRRRVAKPESPIRNP